MYDSEFMLFDRITKIQAVVGKEGESNFSISFSGGKDSTVLSWLVDKALPNNNIPRVYVDTGIDLNMVRSFVYDMSKKDDRIKIIKPSQNIKELLESKGYPFKSKRHAQWVERYNRIGLSRGVSVYCGKAEDGKTWRPEDSCPKSLLYQFDTQNACGFPISDKCCLYLKEKPLKEYQKAHGIKWAITGIMHDEGGRRVYANCITERGTDKFFNPMVPVTKVIEEEWINTYNISICDIYKPPYNFYRTGCKGCPFAKDLQRELDTLAQYFPNERKQCEYIWKPVYDEYRRLNYRLKKED